MKINPEPNTVIATLLLVVFTSLPRAAHSAAKTAVIPVDQTPAVTQFADLMFAALSNRGRLELVERARLEALLAEQDLMAALGNGDPRTWIRAGKLIGADILALVQEYDFESGDREDDTGDFKPIYIRVVEVRAGIRIDDAVVAPPADTGRKADPVADSRRIAERIEQVVTRLGATGNQPRLIGLTEFRNEDLSEKFTWVSETISAALASRLRLCPGTLVLERERTRELLRERTLDPNLPDSIRPSTYIVEGGFRCSGDAPDTTLTVTARVRSAGQAGEPFEVQIPARDARLLGNLLGHRILEELGDTPSVAFDPRKEANLLLKEHRVLHRYMEYEHALRFAEAALAVYPSYWTEVADCLESQWGRARSAILKNSDSLTDEKRIAMIRVAKPGLERLADILLSVLEEWSEKNGRTASGPYVLDRIARVIERSEHSARYARMVAPQIVLLHKEIGPVIGRLYTALMRTLRKHEPPGKGWRNFRPELLMVQKCFMDWGLLWGCSPEQWLEETRGLQHLAFSHGPFKYLPSYAYDARTADGTKVGDAYLARIEEMALDPDPRLKLNAYATLSRAKCARKEYKEALFYVGRAAEMKMPDDPIAPKDWTPSECRLLDEAYLLLLQGAKLDTGPESDAVKSAKAAHARLIVRFLKIVLPALQSNAVHAYFKWTPDLIDFAWDYGDREAVLEAVSKLSQQFAEAARSLSFPQNKLSYTNRKLNKWIAERTGIEIAPPMAKPPARVTPVHAPSRKILSMDKLKERVPAGDETGGEFWFRRLCPNARCPVILFRTESYRMASKGQDGIAILDENSRITKVVLSTEENESPIPRRGETGLAANGMPLLLHDQQVFSAHPESGVHVFGLDGSWKHLTAETGPLSHPIRQLFSYEDNVYALAGDASEYETLIMRLASGAEECELIWSTRGRFSNDNEWLNGREIFSVLPDEEYKRWWVAMELYNADSHSLGKVYRPNLFHFYPDSDRWDIVTQWPFCRRFASNENRDVIFSISRRGAHGFRWGSEALLLDTSSGKIQPLWSWEYGGLVSFAPSSRHFQQGCGRMRPTEGGCFFFNSRGGNLTAFWRHDSDRTVPIREILGATDSPLVDAVSVADGAFLLTEKSLFRVTSPELSLPGMPIPRKPSECLQAMAARLCACPPEEWGLAERALEMTHNLRRFGLYPEVGDLCAHALEATRSSPLQKGLLYGRWIQALCALRQDEEALQILQKARTELPDRSSRWTALEKMMRLYPEDPIQPTHWFDYVPGTFRPLTDPEEQRIAHEALEFIMKKTNKGSRRRRQPVKTVKPFLEKHSGRDLAPILLSAAVNNQPEEEIDPYLMAMLEATCRPEHAPLLVEAFRHHSGLARIAVEIAPEETIATIHAEFPGAMFNTSGWNQPVRLMIRRKKLRGFRDIQLLRNVLTCNNPESACRQLRTRRESLPANSPFRVKIDTALEILGDPANAKGISL